MFKRKKPESDARQGVDALRGRTAAGSATQASSPLARRFLADGEPATVDLAEPGRFHGPPHGGNAEPDTRVTSAQPTGGDARRPLVTLDAATGKLHVHPGDDAHPVRLNGEAVEAPTELRRGDRLQVGVHEFEFLG